VLFLPKHPNFRRFPSTAVEIPSESDTIAAPIAGRLFTLRTESTIAERPFTGGRAPEMAGTDSLSQVI